MRKFINNQTRDIRGSERAYTKEKSVGISAFSLMGHDSMMGFCGGMAAVVLGIALLMPCQPANASAVAPRAQLETTEERAERMAWWKEARFGLFIHWGVYAVPAGFHRGVAAPHYNGEWIMKQLNIPVKEYEQFAIHFDPLAYQAEQWVALAKQAGMKYIVITTKHHDGFCLWDSAVTEWDVAGATLYGKDLLKPLAAACAEAGIKLGFYYSIMDWHHPDAQGVFAPYYNTLKNQKRVNPRFPSYLETYMKPQLQELLSQYGPVDILWFDGEWIPDYTSEMGKEVDAFVRSLQPDIIINNRVDKGRQGMMGLDKEGDFAGDFGTPEQEIPDMGIAGVDWESCMTMNMTWGYRKDDNAWKSSRTLVHNLIDSVSKGGNFLLNIGPKADGVIPKESVERLEQMGRWMSVHGESIYGADASQVAKPDWGRYTTKRDTVYAHLFDWPKNDTLLLKEVKGFSSVEWLHEGGRTKLSFKETAEGIRVRLKGVTPDAFATVLVLTK